MLSKTLKLVCDYTSGNSKNRKTKNEKNVGESGMNEVEVGTGALRALEASPEAEVVDVIGPKSGKMNSLDNTSTEDDEEDPEIVEIVQPFEVNYNVLLQIVMAIEERRLCGVDGEQFLSNLPKHITMYKKKPLDILLCIVPHGLRAYWGLAMNEVDAPPFTVKGTGRWEVRECLPDSSTKIQLESLPMRTVDFTAKETPRSDTHNLLHHETVIISWAHLFKDHQELLEMIHLQRKIETIDQSVSIPLEIKMVVCPLFSLSRKDAVKSYNSKEQTGMVGLENLGATCYLNALLQMLYHINYFRRAVYQIPHETGKVADGGHPGAAGDASALSVTFALQTVFRSLQLERTTVTTKELTKAFGWSSAQAYLQQDVQEMMVKLLEKLGDKMVGTAVEGTVDKIFYGKERSYIRCVNVDVESVREEDMNLITLDVAGCKNVYDSLKKYVTPDRLDGENQYDAGPVHGKQDADKGAEFVRFPPVLTIQLKRFEFDMQKMSFVKVHDEYEFPEMLDMTPFVAKKRQGGSDREGTGAAGAKEQQNEADEGGGEDDDEEEDNVYLLHSVMVHRGDVGGGHYYVYIRTNTPHEDTGATEGLREGEGEGERERDVAEPDGRLGAWYRFDDERVLKVSTREAVNYNFGRSPINTGSASAYMLLYIKQSHVKHVMQGVPAGSISAEARESIESAKRMRAEEEGKMNKVELYGIYDYFTWRSVECFNRFGRHHELVAPSGIKSVRLFKDGASFLGLLFALMRKLRWRLCEMRLYRAHRARREGAEPSTIIDAPVDAEGIYEGETPNQTVIHNEFFDPIKVGSLVFVDTLDISEYEDEENVDWDACMARQLDLLQRDDEFRGHLERALKQYIPGLGDEGFDAIGDNSAVSSEFMLRRLEQYGCPEVANMREMKKNITRDFNDFVRNDYGHQQTSDELKKSAHLVFVRAFDPAHELAACRKIPCPLQVDDFGAGGAPDLLPVKFLGHLRFDEDTTLYEIVTEMLQDLTKPEPISETVTQDQGREGDTQDTAVNLEDDSRYNSSWATLDKMDDVVYTLQRGGHTWSTYDAAIAQNVDYRSLSLLSLREAIFNFGASNPYPSLRRGRDDEEGYTLTVSRFIQASEQIGIHPHAKMYDRWYEAETTRTTAFFVPWGRYTRDTTGTLVQLARSACNTLVQNQRAAQATQGMPGDNPPNRPPLDSATSPVEKTSKKRALDEGSAEESRGAADPKDKGDKGELLSFDTERHGPGDSIAPPPAIQADEDVAELARQQIRACTCQIQVSEDYSYSQLVDSLKSSLLRHSKLISREEASHSELRNYSVRIGYYTKFYVSWWHQQSKIHVPGFIPKHKSVVEYERGKRIATENENLNQNQVTNPYFRQQEEQVKPQYHVDTLGESKRTSYYHEYFKGNATPIVHYRHSPVQTTYSESQDPDLVGHHWPMRDDGLLPVEVVVVDARVRRWRSLYLQHLDSQAQSQSDPSGPQKKRKYAAAASTGSAEVAGETDRHHIYVPRGGVVPEVLSSFVFPPDYRRDRLLANHYDQTYPLEEDRVPIIVNRQLDCTVGSMVERLHFQLGLPQHLNAPSFSSEANSGDESQDSMAMEASDAALAIREQYAAIESVAMQSSVPSNAHGSNDTITLPLASTEQHKHQDRANELLTRDNLQRHSVAANIDLTRAFSQEHRPVEAPEMCSEAVTHGRTSSAFPLLLFSLNADTMRVWFHNPSTALPSTQERDGETPLFYEPWFDARSDATLYHCQLHFTAVQHVTPKEQMLMRNQCPEMRSMVVLVFSFSLLGNAVVPLKGDDLEHFPKPFLSYVASTDSYDDLCRRLGVMAGEEDTCSSYRLAVVKNKEPHFIIRGKSGARKSHESQTVSVKSTLNTDSSVKSHGVEGSENGGGLVWPCFESKYTECAQTSLDNFFANSQLSPRWDPRDTSPDNGWSPPYLGIQRSAASLKKQDGTRSAIKIA